jgi:hypothetical protein
VTVVGETQDMLGSGGDGLAFMTVADAQTVQSDVVGEATRFDPAAFEQSDAPPIRPYFEFFCRATSRPGAGFPSGVRLNRLDCLP